MAYITFQEFKELTGNSELEEPEFNSLLPLASDFMDVQTRAFYQHNDLESDVSQFRRDRFKKAVAYQIEYMHDTGAKSSYDINTPQSWSIGRTSVTEASRYNSTGQNEAPSIISEDAISLLSGTGLLYRGVG